MTARSPEPQGSHLGRRRSSAIVAWLEFGDQFVVADADARLHRGGIGLGEEIPL